MDDRLKEAFHTIYEGEAKAALRLKIFAKKAEQEDLPQIAKLFRVLSFSEELHCKGAINHLIGERETTYYVCKGCGYVSDGVWPEVCPVCSAPKDQFVEFK